MQKIIFARPKEQFISVSFITEFNYDKFCEIREWGMGNLNDIENWNKCHDATLMAMGKHYNIHSFMKSQNKVELQIHFTNKQDAMLFRLVWG